MGGRKLWERGKLGKQACARQGEENYYAAQQKPAATGYAFPSLASLRPPPPCIATE